MPFRTGTVSFARFRVSGGPAAVDSDLLARLEEHGFRLPSVGAPPEVQAGWTAGRHVYDGGFDPETVCFGDTLLLGVRIDVCRVPAEIQRAYRAMAVATRTGDGPAAARDRRDAREEADDRCREELASGRHRRTQHVPLLWDVPRRLVLAPVFGDTTLSVIADLLEATFRATVEPLSAGAVASEWLAAKGRSRDYEDLSPSPFTPAPAGAHSDDHADRGGGLSVPAVPWAFGGPQPKDFLGNEFLIWVWGRCEIDSPLIETPGGSVGIAIDRMLEMDCAWDVTGRQSLRAHGPARLPEAAKALQHGKWPRKAGLLVAARGEQWELTLQADRLFLTAIKLPRPDDAPASEREAVETRLASILELDEVVMELYSTFLAQRVGEAWPGERERLRRWIATRAGAAGPRPAVPALDHAVVGG